MSRTTERGQIVVTETIDGIKNNRNLLNYYFICEY